MGDIICMKMEGLASVFDADDNLKKRMLIIILG